jgi:hypothetical protein
MASTRFGSNSPSRVRHSSNLNQKKEKRVCDKVSYTKVDGPFSSVVVSDHRLSLI